MGEADKTLIADLEAASTLLELWTNNNTKLAARLRDHARRLREEMERARRDDIDGEFNAAAPWYLTRLTRINGGPLVTP